MQNQDLVTQLAELAARVKRIERWQDQWRTRDRKVAALLADSIHTTDEVESSGGFTVAVGRGLCANRHVEFDPGRQSYQAGETVLMTIRPGSEYHSLLPLWWQAPGKSGDVEPIIRFGFNDGTTIDRRATGSESSEEWHPTTYLFFKDGVTCTELSFIADNVGTTQTQALGAFKFQGWQF